MTDYENYLQKKARPAVSPAVRNIIVICAAALGALGFFAYGIWGWLGAVSLVVCAVGALALWGLQGREGATEPGTVPQPRQWTPGPYAPADTQSSGESWQDRVDRLTAEAELTRQSASAPTQQLTTPLQPWQVTAGKGWPEIDRLIEAGDWNSARAALQRVAYGMVDAEADVKARFTLVMGQFAARDPAFKSVLDAALPAISESPGLRQADLYKGMDEEKKELIRYVLYFAAELGQIVRVKKGNSYALYQAGATPNSAP